MSQLYCKIVQHIAMFVLYHFVCNLLDILILWHNNRRIMVSKLLDGVGYLKSKFQTDQLDQKLKEAVSDENWQSSSQVLHDIANHAYNYEKQQRIIAFVWQKLKEKNWKKVLKTLHLVDFLLKYGPTSTIQSFKENIYEFRNLDNYSCIAQGMDRGQSVRKQSKLIVDLISDDSRLNDQRSKAKQIKERMAQVLGSGSHYGSYSNSSPITQKTSSNAYQAQSSSYFSFNKTNNQGNLSFGQSVVKSLQNSKKEPESTFKNTKGPSSFNNHNNVQKKVQVDKKKTPFNSLSMKLVKPPPKKITEQKPQQSNTKTLKIDQMNIKSNQKNTSNMNKPESKPNNNTNIMDLDDLLCFDAPQKEAKSVSNNGNSSVGMLSSEHSFNLQQKSGPNVFDIDFLSSPQGNQPNPPTTSNNNNLPYQNIYALIPNTNTTNNLYNPNISSQSAYAVQQNTQHFQPQMAHSIISQQPSATAIIKLDLSENKAAKKQALDASSLIDFSDFRKQLGSIGAQNKKSITETWNW